MSDIMRMIGDPKMQQAHVAYVYAGLIADGQSEGGSEVDIGPVNLAIMDRWSKSGLERVKRIAWAYALDDARPEPAHVRDVEAAFRSYEREEQVKADGRAAVDAYMRSFDEVQLAYWKRSEEDIKGCAAMGFAAGLAIASLYAWWRSR